MSENLPGEPAQNQMAYVPIRVSTLRGDQKISFDLYVQIGKKHILFIRRGDSFEGTRLGRLKERKVRKMFIQTDDERHYRKYVEGNLDRAYNTDSGVSLDERASMVQGLQEAAVEAVFENPTDAKSYQEAKEGSRRLGDFILKEDKALKALLAVENTDQNLAAHGVSVATYAIGIAKRIGLTDPTSIHFLALGSLLHDLSHYSNGVPYQIPHSQMTKEQMDRFLRHPADGAALVKDLSHMDQHVTQIILEHEEHADGSGFPNKLIERKCNPLSVIVSTANAFDRMVTFDRMKPQEAIKRLVIEKIGKHPLAHINALKAMVSEG
jgi:HD-GYP domain-containing protein (c-di-GMP phosphodiesterase class II)